MSTLCTYRFFGICYVKNYQLLQESSNFAERNVHSKIIYETRFRLQKKPTKSSSAVLPMNYVLL